MKKFLYKVLFFLLPIVILFFAIEIYIRNSPNSFITKADYLNNNLDKIEVLVLGTSHSQNGINPKFFKRNTANLSYGSQDIQIDSALFFKEVPKLKSLKKVIFELDYHRMDIENDADFYRIPWYFIFYDVEVKPVSLINKFSLYSTNMTFFNDIMIADIKSNSKKQVINKYGFVEANYNNPFAISEYDSIKIQKDSKVFLKNRHKEVSVENFNKNKSRIEAMITYCNNNTIEFIIVSSPFYYTYVENEIPTKKEKVKTFIDYLTKKYKVKHLDFESDARFHLKDFSNDDHLNADGAKKYSEILSKEIN